MPKFPPQADNLAVVFVGSFNPAIFHPEWFVRQGMIQEADLENAKLEVSSSDISRFEVTGIGVEVLHERLQLYTRDLSREAFLQDLANSILAKLPHTPIRACGLNSSHHYNLANEGYWHKIGHTLAPKDLIWNGLLENPGMEALTVKGARTGSYPGYVNVTIQPSKQFKYGLFVNSNTHYGSSTEGEPLEMENLLGFMSTEWKPAFQIAYLTAQKIFEKIDNHE
jgi:hypothetical protein